MIPEEPVEAGRGADQRVAVDDIDAGGDTDAEAEGSGGDGGGEEEFVGPMSRSG